MTLTPPCPDEEALLPLAVGDPGDEGVRAHAEGCPHCREALRRLRAEVATLSSWGGALGPAPAVNAGHPATVGKYYLVGRPLAEGRHGPIYRGLDPETNKVVVVRLSPWAADNPTAVPTALQEQRRRLTRLEHPHLARVVEMDFHLCRPFVAAEYLRGDDLERYARAQAPDPWASAALVAQLARALADAHRQGVVHGHVGP